MAQPNATPGSEPPDWVQDANQSLLAGERRKKIGMVAIIAFVLAMLGLGWFLTAGGQEAKEPARPDQNIPDRKPVEKLKPAPAKDETAAQEEAPPSDTPPPPPEADQIKAQREQLRLQRQADAARMRDARLKSAIVIYNGDGQGPAARMQPSGVEPSRSGPGGAVADGAQDGNSRFARAVSGGSVAVSRAEQLADLEHTIWKGKMIEAVTEQRAISDLPGTICAIVQRDVFGAQGRIPLIPWGARMCGVYSADLRKGQERLFVVWNEVTDAKGVRVSIDSIGSDQLGTSGMGGQVDTHFAQIFGVSALLSIIGAGVSNAGVSSSDQNNSSAAYRESVQQAAAQTSQQALQPYINIPPTIIVPHGTRVRVLVNRDLSFGDLYKAQAEAVNHDDDITFIR